MAPTAGAADSYASLSFNTMIGPNEQRVFLVSLMYLKTSASVTDLKWEKMKDLVKWRGKSAENSWLTTDVSISLLMRIISEKKPEKQDASSSSEDELGIAGSSVRPIKLFKKTNVRHWSPSHCDIWCWQ